MQSSQDTKKIQSFLNSTLRSSSGYHTVIIYDLDTSRETFVHSLTINVQKTHSGDVLIDPDLHQESTLEGYQVEIYKQNNYIDPESFYIFDEFIDTADLTLINEIFIETLNPIGNQQSRNYEDHSNNKDSQDSLQVTTNYFKQNNNLTDQQKKFCECTIKVSSKQPEQCNIDKAWFQQREGKQCYNPYAVCAKSTGTSVGRSNLCEQNFDYESISDRELRGKASLSKIQIPNPYSRHQMINNIQNRVK